ncbi:MAG: AlpA family phage regulatory protein [Burkholderiaceae bacterium]|nr:AlpA family phage regulatory protein [Burkholderiaceae bacterium]
MSQSVVAETCGQPEPAFYRMADVLRITALSRSSLYRRIASGDFPVPVSLGGRAKGWRRAALLEWIEDPVRLVPAVPDERPADQCLGLEGRLHLGQDRVRLPE